MNDPWRIERAVNTAGRSVSDGGRLGVGVALSLTGQRPYGHMACWVTWQTCASERLGVKRAVHFPAGSVAVKSARELCGHGDAGKGAGVEMHGGHKVDKHDEATEKNDSKREFAVRTKRKSIKGSAPGPSRHHGVEVVRCGAGEAAGYEMCVGVAVLAFLTL